MDEMLSGFCKGEAWMIMLSALPCIVQRKMEEI